jgi:hypothetical protein
MQVGLLRQFTEGQIAHTVKSGIRSLRHRAFTVWTLWPESGWE